MSPTHRRLRWSSRGFAAATLTLFVATANRAFPTDAATATAPAPDVAPEPPYVAPENPDELLKVSEPMRQFFHLHVTGAQRDGSVLRQIVQTIVQRDGLNFIYDDEGTFDVREAFRRRSGNCLTFAMLVVAVARDYGYDAEFQNVQLPERWDRYGENIVTIQHVNVRVETDDGPFVVDLRPELVPRSDSFPMERVSDAHVFATFYSDVGFFHLVHGRPADAMRAMTLATTIDPNSASAWSNRATLMSRLGDFVGAHACFERAYKLDSWAMSGLVGYVNVLQRLGSPADLELAHKLERRAQKLRDRNPYYHEYLAQTATARHEWQVAEKSLRRAIALKDDEPDFYTQLIAALQQLGRADEAQRVANRLERLQRDLNHRSPYLHP